MHKRTVTVALFTILLLPMTLALVPVKANDPLRVSVDVKPGSWPNPINVGSKGVFAVAICGTEGFDVTQIDPTSVKICAERAGDGVSPLRWSYEDVSTPYTGDSRGGHDLGSDGYLDLVLIFHTQTVSQIVTWTEPGHFRETLPVMIEGNLKPEFDGARIEGQDWVLILAPMKPQG